MSTDVNLISPIDARPEFAGILRSRTTYARGRPDDLADRVNGWYDRLLQQSGLEASPATWLMLSVFAGVTAGGTVLLRTDQSGVAIVAAFVGLMVPVLIALWKRRTRQSRILEQLPDMVDQLARAVRTGRSLDSCLTLVAGDTRGPLGEELRRVVRRVDLGLTIHDAAAPLPERTGVPVLQMLVTALAVHGETGGDLVVVLERFAGSARDRLLFRGRMRAATAGSRATAVLMVLLPPVIITFFLARDPGYLSRLLESGWGQFSFWTAIGLQILGSALVLRIVRRTGVG